MKVRLGNSDDGTEMVFNGIKGQEKLKAFFMADMLAYCAYRKYSNIYFSKSDGKDPKLGKMVSSIKTAVKSYSGFYTGTPADQISKRVDNFIALLRGQEQTVSDDKPAVRAEKANADICRNIAVGDDRAPQPTVRIQLPENRFKDKYKSQHVPMSAVLSWIKEDILESAKSDPCLQTVYRTECETKDGMEGMSELGEDLSLDIARTFLAMKCIMNAEMDCIGETFSFVLNETSLIPLFPAFRKPVMTGNLVYVADGIDVKPLEKKFGRSVCISKGNHPLENEIEMFKARLALDGEDYNLLLATDDRPYIRGILSAAERMRWKPLCTTVISESCADLPDDAVCIIRSGDCVGDAASMFDIGICNGDPYSLAVLRTAYKDVLTELCNDIVITFESARPLEIVDAIREYFGKHAIPSDSKYYELGLALLSAIDAGIGRL